MTVLISDSFNRANSTTTLGSTDSYNGGTSTAWQALVGTWGISNNQAYNAGNTNNAVAVVDSGVSDCKVTVTVGLYSSVWKMIFRVSDGTNFFCITGTSLFKVVNGGFTSLGTIPAFTTGDILSITLNGSSITVYENGTNVLSVTNTYNQTATKHGLSANNATPLFDNFQIEDLNTGGTSLTLSLSDSITLSETTISQIRSGFLNINESLTLSESFTKIRQGYLSVSDSITFSDSEINSLGHFLLKALNDSITLTDSITIQSNRYMTIFDLLSISESMNLSEEGSVFQVIQLKRGNEATLPQLNVGEPAVTLDTKKVFFGTADGNVRVATLLTVNSVSALPTPNQTMQYMICGVNGATGVADAIYMCKKLSNDTYDWVQFV